MAFKADVDILSDLTEMVPLRNQPLYSGRKMKLLITVTGILVLTGTLADTAYHYDALRRLGDIFIVLIIFSLFLIPIGAFVLSLIISLFPIKGRCYTKKLLPAWLWAASILSAAQIIYFLGDFVAGKYYLN